MKKFTEFFTDEHISKLMHQLLFSGLTEHEIFMFIQHSKPLYDLLKEGGSIRIADKYSHMIGLVISGSTYVYNVDYDGNKTLLKTIGNGENSGTLYSMFGYHNALIELVARRESEVLLLDPETLFIVEEKLADIQQKILVNLIASQRQIFLDISEHIACLSQRSIKGKVMHLLVIQCERQHSNTVKIPFSREELANYLAVDRASLSRSLSELKQAGIIDFAKNRFTLLQTKNVKYEQL